MEAPAYTGANFLRHLNSFPDAQAEKLLDEIPTNGPPSSEYAAFLRMLGSQRAAAEAMEGSSS
jgi:hypothetical protein